MASDILHTMLELYVDDQGVAGTDALAPRKRRKRAPAAGAAADCFTCATRHLKCDRRRPYCSQCLEDGKDCAGYKTQLTWGNGVASRGKLRGLSLPVAGTQKIAAPGGLAKPKKRPSQNQSCPEPQVHRQQQLFSGLLDVSSPSNIGSKPPDTFHAFQIDRPTGSFPASARLNSDPWTPLIATSPLTSSRPETEPATYSPASSIPALLSPLDGFTFATRFQSNIGHSDTNHASHSSHTCSFPDNPPFGRVRSHGSIATSSSLPTVYPPYPCPYDDAISETRQYLVYQPQESAYSPTTTYTQPLPPQTLDAPSDLDNEPERQPAKEAGGDGHNDICVGGEEGSVVGLGIVPVNYSWPMSPLAGIDAIGTTPRMQYLIKYYIEVISPVIVAFDGPSNPYRTQILRLAAKSETLQHAISALSASNLRQRRETGALSTGKTDPARRSSMAHLTLTNGPLHNMSLLSAEEQAREESRHKRIAIQSLNKQLADPVLRKDDSILATLLILCLFHICDSGVAKFQTQFAGVKKLLSLRTDLGLKTKETKWFTRMFTWFDAMTATVNDREGQMQGHYLDICARSDEDWALENLAGCEGQLFKTIAKLGRLNVLSQGKSVDSMPALVPRPIPQAPPVSHLDYRNFDGNGWMRLAEDEKLYTIKTADADVQTQFWREWREIRQALQMWDLDTATYDSFNPDAPYLTSDQRIDLANISESFRYAALLYTERLASPTVPSTDPRIRTWVEKCVTYIKAVKSDVYLLWPLFITGSECVSEQDRSVIRERCLDIQKDSGFLNNKSCLELLEKVWHRSDDRQNYSKIKAKADMNRNPDKGGLKFTRIMKLEGNEGEYIVV